MSASLVATCCSTQVRTPPRSCRSGSAAADSALRRRRAVRCRWTSYMIFGWRRRIPGLVASYLHDHGVSTRLIALDGAVETAIRLGVADVIADVVETGTTLREAGLELFGDPILHSEAILIRRTGAEPPSGLDLLERRLNGVLVARNYVMMDYDVTDDLVAEACAITPGLESPTVSPLAKEGWRAVRAMVPRADAQQIMDDLWALGARAILVTDIAACRI